MKDPLSDTTEYFRDARHLSYFHLLFFIRSLLFGCLIEQFFVAIILHFFLLLMVPVNNILLLEFFFLIGIFYFLYWQIMLISHQILETLEDSLAIYISSIEIALFFILIGILSGFILGDLEKYPFFIVYQISLFFIPWLYIKIMDGSLFWIFQLQQDSSGSLTQILHFIFIDIIERIFKWSGYIVLFSLDLLFLISSRLFRYYGEKGSFICYAQGCGKRILDDPILACHYCEGGEVQTYPKKEAPLYAPCNTCGRVYPTWIATNKLLRTNKVKLQMPDCTNDLCCKHRFLKKQTHLLVVNHHPFFLADILEGIQLMGYTLSPKNNDLQRLLNKFIQDNQIFFLQNRDITYWDHNGLQSLRFETETEKEIINISIIEQFLPAIWSGDYQAIIFLPPPTLIQEKAMTSYILKALVHCSIITTKQNWGDIPILPKINFRQRIFLKPRAYHKNMRGRQKTPKLILYSKKNIQLPEIFGEKIQLFNNKRQIHQFIKEIIQ